MKNNYYVLRGFRSGRGYSSAAEIPARYAFATANTLATKPAYYAHSTYASALNRAAKTGDSILRRYASTTTFTVAR